MNNDIPTPNTPETDLEVTLSPTLTPTLIPSVESTSKLTKGFSIISETPPPSGVPLIYNSDSDSSISVFTYFIYAVALIVVFAALFQCFCR